MSLRFFRRIRVAPGVTLNLSKTGISASAGPRGAKYTVGTSGQRATVGLPGTGLFYTKHSPRGGKMERRSGTRAAQVPSRQFPETSPPDLNFFQRLTASPSEKQLVAGCRALSQGERQEALSCFEETVEFADGAFLAGFLALGAKRLGDAASWLGMARAKHGELGRHFEEFGLTLMMSMPVTEELRVQVEPDLRGALLGLVEVYQRQNRISKALECLEELRELEPDDVVVRLSMAEILLEEQSASADACHRVIQLTQDVENESEFHAGLLLYKGNALRKLNLHAAARDVLTSALRRRKDRPQELLHALRYERAHVYLELGQRSRAREEFGRLYAEDPDYRDVSQRALS